VVSDQAASLAATTAAYVSAAPGKELLVTAPTVGGPADDPAGSVIARAGLGDRPVSAVLSRSVVGVVRVPNGLDRVISIRATPGGDADGLAVSTLTADGLQLRRSDPVAVGLPSVAAIAFAQNDSGDEVLAWFEARIGTGADPVSSDILRLRVATGKWGVLGRPQTLQEIRGEHADEGAVGVEAAINGHGQAAVASAVEGVSGIPVRIGDARTSHFGSPVIVPSTDLVGPLRVVITDDDRTSLAWRNSDGDSMDPHGRVTVYAVMIAPGDRRASPVWQIDRGPVSFKPSSGLDLIAAPGGIVTLAFSAPRDTASGPLREAAFATSTTEAGRFGPVQELASDGSVGGLALRADGAVIVTIRTRPGRRGTPFKIEARLRKARATRFGPAETVATIPALIGAQPVTTQPRYAVSIPPPGAPIPTFDPSTGQPIVAYTTAAHGSPTGRVIVVARDRP
jgi:hypothetical protein